MSLEIERKFTVAEGWRVPADAGGEQLRQAYLTPPGAPVEFRVRARRDARLMTVKTFDSASGAMVRQEVEFEIDAAVFEQLWELADGDCLSKFRWSVPLERQVATVDEYDGALSGLRVVEVEFDSVEEARAFEPPGWFGEEVTGSPAWSNRELAASAGAAGDDGPGGEGETR
ncbi:MULTISPECIES: CYTH domain-containing protein [unclassified Streptomyces]|uniref:CYTH domain-containing protein n=1 Tax=unclassified Streptomyces TaxID=2593676 RepID=UPI00380959D7